MQISLSEALSLVAPNRVTHKLSPIPLRISLRYPSLRWKLLANGDASCSILVHSGGVVMKHSCICLTTGSQVFTTPVVHTLSGYGRSALRGFVLWFGHFSGDPREPQLKPETGRIRLRRVRFQTQAQWVFCALTEFRAENSVSSSKPIICVPKRTHWVCRGTHRVFRGTHWVGRKTQWGSVSSLLRNNTLETVFSPVKAFSTIKSLWGPSVPPIGPLVPLIGSSVPLTRASVPFTPPLLVV